MILNLNLLRKVGLNLLTVGTLPLLRLLLAAVLRLAPPTDFQPPQYLHEEYDFIVGKHVPGRQETFKCTLTTHNDALCWEAMA